MFHVEQFFDFSQFETTLSNSQSTKILLDASEEVVNV